MFKLYILLKYEKKSGFLKYKTANEFCRKRGRTDLVGNEVYRAIGPMVGVSLSLSVLFNIL